MDMKTLLITGLVISVATNLSMATVWWTRRTYPGFGYWVAGTFCRTLGGVLFLSRGILSPWLAIVLANTLLLAELMLNVRGLLVFRGRRTGLGWEIALLLSFFVAFAWFTQVSPDINSRIVLFCLFAFVFQVWAITVLLSQRPAYFGSGDWLQTITLGVLAGADLVRAVYTGLFEIPLADFMTAPTIQVVMILINLMTILLLALSQIIMNAQRIEYDYRMVQERLDLALDGGNIGLYTAYLSTSAAFFDERFQRIIGYHPGERAFTVQDWLEGIHPEDQPGLLPRYEEVVKGLRSRYESEYRVRHRDGSWIWVMDRGKSFDPNQTGQPQRIAGTLIDISERKQIEAALRESETKFRLAFDNANTGMCLVDLEGRLLQVNARMCAIFGYSKTELEGMTVNDLVLPEDSAVSLQFIQRATHGDTDSATFEKRYCHRLGHVLYGQIASSLVRDAQGQPLYFISQVQDITDRKRLEAELREQAIHDPLTGLFNRRYLDETLPRELSRCQRSGEPLAVAMLDLDHFKQFKDAYGHEAGDSALRTVGELLRRSLRGGDIACRYGGEELVLILPGAALDDARARLDKLRETLMGLHITYRGGELPAITVSIGLAAAEPEETDAAALLSRVDAALYQAKARGRNCIVNSGA